MGMINGIGHNYDCGLPGELVWMTATGWLHLCTETFGDLARHIGQIEANAAMRKEHYEHEVDELISQLNDLEADVAHLKDDLEAAQEQLSERGFL